MPAPKISAATIAQLLVAARQGKGKAACAAFAGIHRDTLDAWLRSSRAGTFAIPGFHTLFEAQRAEHRRDEARKIAERLRAR